MDFGEMDTLMVEKRKAMKTFKRNRKAKKYLRYAIVAVSAVLLSWSSVWIPIVVHTATLYIRFACTVITSSRFVFFMCIVITITLAAKSGQLSSPGGSNSGSTDLYEEFVKTAENRPKYVINLEAASLSDEPEEEKHCVSEDPIVSDEPEDKSTVSEESKPVEILKTEVTSSDRCKYARSQSEKLESKHPRKLRRSDTCIENHHPPPENSDNSCNCDEYSSLVEASPPDESYESNEALRKRFEEFIARQRKSFHPSNEGSMAIVNV